MRSSGMYSRPARVARGFAAAGTSTLIAALSHSAGGGVFPHPLLLLLGLVVSGLLCIALTGRRVSVIRMVPAVLGSQLLFHLLFATAAPAGSSAGALGSATMPAGHSHGAMLSLAADRGSEPMLDGGMVGAHLIAAVATILALRFGEAAFWGLLDTARLLLVRLFGFATPTSALEPAGAPVRAADVTFVRVLAPTFLTSLRHRGPPVARLLG